MTSCLSPLQAGRKHFDEKLWNGKNETKSDNQQILGEAVKSGGEIASLGTLIMALTTLMVISHNLFVIGLLYYKKYTRLKSCFFKKKGPAEMMSCSSLTVNHFASWENIGPCNGWVFRCLKRLAERDEFFTCGG